MRKAYIIMTFIAATAALTVSCSAKRGIDTAGSGDPAAAAVTAAEPGMIKSSLPMAVVYKTSGNYADNVPVTLNASRTALVSYPAPTDLTEGSTPLQLADGYLLDRRGVNANSAFLRLTYADYRALSQAPSPQALMEMIIPGSEVTALVRLPFTASEAAADTAACNRLIRSGFEGCDIVRMPLTARPVID